MLMTVQAFSVSSVPFFSWSRSRSSMRIFLFVALLGAVSALNVEKRDTAGGHDTGGSYGSSSSSHSSGGYGASSHDSGYGASSSSHDSGYGASSSSSGGYGASQTYSEPQQTYSEPASQGNLYYYYYPVKEHYGYGHQPTVADDGGNPLLGLLIPLLLLGLLIPVAIAIASAVSGGTISFGRSLVENDTMSEFQSEVDRLFYVYLNAAASEQCMERIICELGSYTSDWSSRPNIELAIQKLVPEDVSSKVSSLKKASIEGIELQSCRKYSCHPPKIL